MDEIRLDFKVAEQVRRGGCGCAVGTVDEHPQSAQIILNGTRQVLNIFIFQVFHAVDALTDLRSFFERHRGVGEDFLLHPLLQRVGELVAQTVKHFDAVVFKGIVAGGDDHACIGLHLHGQIRHGGGGDSTQGHDVPAYRGDAGDQRALQHVGGNAGIHANGNQRGTPRLLRQHGGHGLAHPVGQLRRQILAYYSTYTIGSKQLSHKTSP